MMSLGWGRMLILIYNMVFRHLLNIWLIKIQKRIFQTFFIRIVTKAGFF